MSKAEDFNKDSILHFGEAWHRSQDGLGYIDAPILYTTISESLDARGATTSDIYKLLRPF